MEYRPVPMPPCAVVLAVGATDRMRSQRPQGLHALSGKPMVQYVIDAIRQTLPHDIKVVVSDGAERVLKRLQEDATSHALDVVEQRTARGSGDALAVGLEALTDDPLSLHEDGDVLVVPGHMPLLSGDLIEQLLDAHRDGGWAATMLTVETEGLRSRPRVVRDRRGRVARVVEAHEATPEEQMLTEVATGVWCFQRDLVTAALRRVRPDSASGQSHVSDVVQVLAETGHQIGTVQTTDLVAITTVSDRVQLAATETEMRARTNEYWMREGVTMVDPAQTYIDTTVSLAQDVTLFPGTMLRGRTVVGARAEIGPNTKLVDCAVGAGARVLTTMGTDAEVGPDAVVGPFAVLNPGASVAAGEVTGSFFRGTA